MKLSRPEIGQTVYVRGEPHVVHDISNAEFIQVVSGDGEVFEVTQWDTKPVPLALRNVRGAYDAAFDVQQAKALRLSRHLDELHTGFMEGYATDDQHEPHSRYRPSLPLRVRRETKAAELGVDTATLRRWESRFKRYGLDGLIDLRSNRYSPEFGYVDERIIILARNILKNRENKSTITTKNIIRQVRHAADEWYEPGAVNFPTTRTMYRLIGKLDRAGLATGPAPRRRSNIRGRSGRATPVTAPGQVVQIDSTPVNLLIRDSDGNRVRCEIALAEDVGPRKIIGFRVSPTAQSIDSAMLIADIIAPDSYRTGAAEQLKSILQTCVEPLGLPREIFEEWWNRPAVLPQELLVDNGSSYAESKRFREACSEFRIAIQKSRLARPEDKGVIERRMRTLDTDLLQLLPGYVGNSVANRGKFIEEEPLLTVDQLSALIACWAVAQNNKPHPALRNKTDPDQMLTPNDAWNIASEVVTQRTLPDPDNTVMRLFDTEWRHVSRRGVTIHNLLYNSPDLDVARGRPSKHRNQNGKWLFKVDTRWMNQVWFNHPQKGLILIPWTGQTDMTGEFSREHAAAHLKHKPSNRYPELDRQVTTAAINSVRHGAVGKKATRDEIRTGRAESRLKDAQRDTPKLPSSKAPKKRRRPETVHETDIVPLPEL